MYQKIKWYQIIKCMFGKHIRVYFSDIICKKNGWMGGIFAPWECACCGKESKHFNIPPQAARRK